MSNTLRMTHLSTARLTFTPEEQTLSACASDVPKPSRAFKDAADVGYDVRHLATGKTYPFLLKKGHRDGEGELTHWEYTSEKTTLKLVIFND